MNGPGLVAAYLAAGEDDTEGGVVLAVINLKWIGERSDSAAQRYGATILLLDGASTLVAGSADQENLIGKRFAVRNLAHDMLGHDEGTATTEGFDSIRRIFASADAGAAPVGLDERVIHASIDHESTVA